MLIYAINRILQIIPVIFILSVLVFGFVHALPGDVIDTLTATDGEEDPEVRAALEEEFGIEFTDSEISKMINFSLIKEIIKSY